MSETGSSHRQSGAQEGQGFCLSEERRQYLQDLRLHYIKDGAGALESYEKSTLTLFGVSLAASVGLANELLKDAPSIALPTLLWVSWGLQALAILVLLASFLLSHLGFEKLTGLVDQQLANPDKQIEIVPHRGLSTTVRTFNWGSFTAFAIGLICFIVFAAGNISKEPQMSSDPKKPAQPLEEIRKGNPGYAPAPAAPSPTQTPPSTQSPPAGQPSQPSTPAPGQGINK